MPLEVTIMGRGRIARLADWLEIATKAYVNAEADDYRMALTYLQNESAALLAELQAAVPARR